MTRPTWLIQFHLQRVLQGGQQNANDAGKGEDGVAGEVDRLVAVPGDEIRVGETGNEVVI